MRRVHAVTSLILMNSHLCC